MKLSDQQAALAHWVLNPKADGTPKGLSAIKDLSAEGGATLYRDSILEVEIRALLVTFPVVLNLVGDTYFRAAAKAYLRGPDAPATNGNLDLIGENFPAFLPTIEGADRTPYLADIAHFELAINKAETGPDTNAPDAKTLAAMMASPGEAAFKLCANGTPLQSLYPVDEIRQACLTDFKQTGGTLDISSTEQPINLMIWRPADEVLMKRLSPAEHALLKAIDTHSHLLSAIEQATRKYPDLDLPETLATATSSGWLEVPKS